MLALGAALAIGLACYETAVAARFDASLSRAEIETEFRRLANARELAIDRPLDWVFSFAGPESAKLEALSLRLVRDGYRIVSLQSAGATTVLRVARTELHSPASLERRNRELANLAHELGVPSYEGADVEPAR